MSTQIESAASDAPSETEPTQVTEQTATESYGEALLKMAAEDGHEIGNVPPKSETVEPETLESEVPATEPETEVVPDEPEPEAEPDEEKPGAKKGEQWPASASARVAEETAKRKRANERADKAEALVQQYQAQLQQIVVPRPVEDDPFRDVNDVATLERLERSYEKAIDLADENPDGAIDVPVGKNPDGSDKLMDFTPEKLVEMRRKADKAIRKFIPERRDYLQQRAVQDAQAAEAYPELKDPNSEFTQMAGQLAYSLINGQAMKAPDVLVWIARAVKGYQLERSQNGKNGATVKGPVAKQIVAASRQRIAPAPVRSRTTIDRGGGSANVEKATKEFDARGDKDSAEALVGALLSRGSGSSNKVVQ